jgi:peptide/nickel transport system substrate-binding protein
VIRHILWQAVLALLGIALIFIILFRLGSSLTTVEVPAAGGIYVEGVLGYAETINPILAPRMVQANPLDQDLSALVFEGLTSLDETGQVSPSLAIDWDVSEDGTVYEFRLRQGVTWHDGAPFAATDVAFTVQAMQDAGYGGDPALRELWRNVTVHTVDDHTVRFTLTEPLPAFLYYTTIGLLPAHLLSAVPAADLPEHSFSTRQPVGTGMFQVESVSPDGVILVVNPNYWASKPYLERLGFRFFGDWDGLLAAYERGEIHGFHLDRPQSLSLVAGMPNLRLYSAQSAGYGVVYLNLQRDSAPFFQETEVRQALLYAMDRQALIDQVLEGQGLVAHSPILPTTWAYDPSVRRYLHDPERAIGLMDASGWLDSDGDRIRDQDGVELGFTLLTGDDPMMLQMAEEIANQWQAVGVDVTIRPMSGEALADSVRRRNFDAVLIEIGLSADPDPYPLWHSTQVGETGQNYSGFANEEADMVMEEGRLSIDLEQRTQLYRTFQQIFAKEVPSLLVYHPIYTYAVDAGVYQVQLAPMLHTSDRFRNVRVWYLETQAITVSEKDRLDKIGE